MADPMIALKHSERLFVALSVVTQELEKKSDYPTDTLHLVLHAYETARNSQTKKDGWAQGVIEAVISTAADELLTWLAEREENSEQTKGHLDQWEREFE